MTPWGEELRDAFLATGLVKSAGEFKRLVKQGGLWSSGSLGDEDATGMRRVTPKECGL